MDKTNSSWLKTFSIGFSIISVGITVAIIGYFVLTTKQTQPANQQSISIPPTIAQPSPTPSNETANWKTYTNAKYGYSIKYPAFLKIGSRDYENVDKSKGNVASFLAPEYAIHIYSGVTGEAGQFMPKARPEETITIANQSVKKIVSVDETLIHIEGLKNNGKEYIITYFAYNTSPKRVEKSLRGEDIFNQILSTFRFI